MPKQKYKDAIATILNSTSEKIFLYWKGRVALYAILKAMGVSQSDEVILPAFTCVVVPNAIMYLGAKPVYVDICEDTFNSDFSKIKESINERTKVIICQNTFGLSSNIEEITELANSNNIFTIEDCTHGFGGEYNGKPNGSYCDAAFYSTQWNKPFSTGIGGFLIVNNDKLIDKVELLEKEKIQPSVLDQIVLYKLLFFNRYFVNRYTQGFLLALYRFLSKKNLIIGSTQGREISDLSMPRNYFKDISYVQVKAGIKKLKNLRDINRLRKKNASTYTQFLKSNEKKYISEKDFNNHLFLKYPIMVSDRRLFLKRAQDAHIILGDWFFSPIYPVKENLNRWGFDAQKFPIAVDISKKVLNLPTEVTNNSKVLDFMNKNSDLIL